jgi:alpha-tubulin suppressor-like RCC1 family protein
MGGVIGDGTYVNRYAPVAVAPGMKFKQVSVSETNACAIEEGVAGKVYCWGSNSQGQLMDGTTVSHPTPALAVPTSEFVATMGGYSVALGGSGVWAYGRNSSGQIGDGTTTAKTSATLVRDGGYWPVAVALGFNHRCSLMAGGGIVRCVGYNAFGELGDGTVVDRLTPVTVSGLAGVKAISAGDGFTCAIKADRTVWCWGQNWNGQLGDGTTTARASPVQAAGIGNAVSVAVGARHACALLDDGAVVCWGDNFLGQLGDGTVFARPIPTKVKF